MRLQKRVRLDALANDAAELLEREGRATNGWQAGELNNARLASMVLYEGRVPEFRAILEHCEQRIKCFYAEARALAGR